MKIHYGTLHDCLVLAGRVCWDCTGSINQALFRSVAELGKLSYFELMPWGMIEELLSHAPSMLEEHALMQYDMVEKDHAVIYIESLPLNTPAVTSHTGTRTPTSTTSSH